ncbi:hypothetical protein A3J90_03860 [candidate division WOR-1 bacterium RIFOXYC2_FULL_37_10]|nr:MAG: hypothetical protein A2246_04875 [candidate division WOR-1 bacterium RIFOXYA2_FULL_37_7]OGC32863.1 MAG: hypothetical protein A3J90_03860 [candidate division WOR-1 bacterium RIFOXYC2_FULL_37_10]
MFFSSCTMRCVYCQNWQISWEGTGNKVSRESLTDKMLELQEEKCHNINLVSPTQYVNQIIEAIKIAKKRGLRLPIVYNTNGYDTVATIKKLDGIVDIYLPDIKYSDDNTAYRFSGVKNYVKRNREAILEMYKQVGNLKLDSKDIAFKGLLVRHLVLPEDIAGSYASLEFLASISREIWISIMAQYHPCYKAKENPPLDRKITKEEYQQVLRWVDELGFENVLAQELESADCFLPDFNKKKPF